MNTVLCLCFCFFCVCNCDWKLRNLYVHGFMFVFLFFVCVYLWLRTEGFIWTQFFCVCAFLLFVCVLSISGALVTVDGRSRGKSPWTFSISHEGMQVAFLLTRTVIIICPPPWAVHPVTFCLTKWLFFQGEENTRRHEEQGEVVMVTEHRELDGGNRRGHIVIRVSHRS